MDSKKPNDSGEHLGDQAVARRIGKVLERAALHSDADCPDAEILAAYFERALPQDEIAQCENHLASCVRCRRMLATIANAAETSVAVEAAPPIVELGTGKLGTAAAQPLVTKPLRPKGIDWRLRWLAPAFGVAAVVVVYFAARPAQHAPALSDRETLVAQAPESNSQPIPPPPAPEQLAVPSSKQEVEQKASTQERQATTDSPAIPQPSNALANPRQRDTTVTDETVSAGRKKDAEVAARVDSGSGGVAGAEALSASPKAAPAAPTPAAQQPAQFGARASSGIPAPAATAQSVVVAEEAPQIATRSGTPNPSAIGGVVAGDAKSAIGQSTAENKAAQQTPANSLASARALYSLQKSPGNLGVLLKSATGTDQWRAGNGGVIERSTDAGTTWNAQTSPSREDWLAGAGVSDQIGWLVGRKAAIARTIDGVHWTHIAPPSLATIAAGMPPDWIAVTATDAQNAMITSADQHRYVTQDGGKTWRAQP